MKPFILSCLLCLFTTSAAAEAFDERMSAGKRAEGTPQGGAYLQTLGPAYGAAMRICIPPGSTSPENLGRFELVADVGPEGRVKNAVVRPVTPISRCFANELVKFSLAAAPPAAKDNPYPIYVEMKVAP